MIIKCSEVRPLAFIENVFIFRMFIIVYLIIYEDTLHIVFTLYFK